MEEGIWTHNFGGKFPTWLWLIEASHICIMEKTELETLLYNVLGGICVMPNEYIKACRKFWERYLHIHVNRFFHRTFIFPIPIRMLRQANWHLQQGQDEGLPLKRAHSLIFLWLWQTASIYLTNQSPPFLFSECLHILWILCAHYGVG